MKLAIRAFAVCVVLTGAIAATLSPAPRHHVASRQSATSELPIPVCGPGVPTCDPNIPPTVH
jgi:hypothetical protein